MARKTVATQTEGDVPRRGFSAAEAARYLGFWKSYLDHLRLSGGGPRYARVGARIRYVREDLDAWIEGLPRYASCPTVRCWCGAG